MPEFGFASSGLQTIEITRFRFLFVLLKIESIRESGRWI